MSKNKYILLNKNELPRFKGESSKRINYEECIGKTLIFKNINTDQIYEIKIVEYIKDKCHKIYANHEEVLGEESARSLERNVLLHNVDQQWMDHIDAMEQLKQGIGLRSYGQRDPIVEYRVESFDMFEEMIAAIRENTAKMLLCFKFGSLE